MSSTMVVLFYETLATFEFLDYRTTKLINLDLFEEFKIREFTNEETELLKRYFEIKEG